MSPCKYPTIYSRKDSQYWWISWYNETGRIRSYTGYLISKHSRDEVFRIYCKKYDVEQPYFKQAGPILEQMKDNILTRIEYEGLRDSTIKEYRIAMDHLINIFGEQYPVKEIQKSDFSKIKKYLTDIGNQPSKLARKIFA